VNDLLDLARLGAVDFAVSPAILDLAEFVSQACEVWSYRCSEADVTFECRSDVRGEFTVDPIRMRQIIDNLTENALRVTPSGGTISFTMNLTESIQGQRKIAITIQDTGPGLTDEDLAVAFQPGALYERYRGVRPVGTGLGLALVDRLAVGLGGAALAENCGESGARFSITIPEMQLPRAAKHGNALTESSQP
jgi:two-component system sensor histidine kinase BaeS